MTEQNRGNMRILLIEDSEDDAALIERILLKNNFHFTMKRVQTPLDLENSLNEEEWDIILSDFSLPQFNGLEALHIANKLHKDIPFILVSGALDLESAVNIMRAGARDFINKNDLARLGPAILREVNEFKNRQARLKAEVALNVSHAGLMTVLDSLEALVYVADMETYEIIFINKYCRNHFGDITGKLCWQTIQRDQNGPCGFCTNKYLFDNHGKPGPAHIWDFQNTVTNQWFHITDKAIEWLDGRIVRLEIAQDISQIKESEIQLKRDEERIKSLLRLSHFIWNSKEELADFAIEEAVRLTESKLGYLHFFNQDQQTIELFSWSKNVRDQCRVTLDQHYPLDRAGLWADSVRNRTPAIHNDYKREAHRKDFPEGHMPITRHMSVPVFEGDKVVALVGVGNKEEPYNKTDVRQLSLYMTNMWGIFKQKQAEIEATKSREEWAMTFDAIDEIVTIHDLDMHITRANRAACQLFNKNLEEIVGKKCYELFREDGKPCEGCPELDTLKHLQPFTAEIYHEKFQKTFDVTSSPLLDEKGELLACIHIAKDITEKKMVESQLRQAQKMEAIGTLAGGIAHDFNNILAPILGFSELALEKVPPTSSISSDIKQVINASKRAKDLVKQILTFSRETEHELRPIQLHLIIKETLKLLRASLPSTIEIKLNIQTDCGTVLGDPTQLHQIIMNLCTNAFHAMRDKGGILGVGLSRVEIEESDSKVAAQELAPGVYAVLEISDTGHGMSHELIGKIFEPYFTTKPKGQGTGLGLSVVHGIVKNHNGHISVYSEAGKGTTFRVYLPDIQEKNIQHEPPKLTPLPGGNERILIIDDEKILVDVQEAMLLSLGYKVSAFTNCEEALKSFRLKPDNFDLVITDMTMPKITGIQLTQEILALRPEIPVILSTGFSELITENDAKALGIRKYLMKPVTKKDLALAVKEVLNKNDH